MGVRERRARRSPAPPSQRRRGRIRRLSSTSTPNAVSFAPAAVGDGTPPRRLRRDTLAACVTERRGRRPPCRPRPVGALGKAGGGSRGVELEERKREALELADEVAAIVHENRTAAY